jgi:hypothetical protein
MKELMEGKAIGHSRIVSKFDWNFDNVPKDELQGCPGFRRGDFADALAMAELFQPKSYAEVFGGDGKVGVEEFYHSGHKLRSICPNFMSSDGSEILIVEIDWGDFTNAQLVKEFAQWLKENNPAGISRPDERGQKRISDRVELERLGVLRLHHRFRLAELQTTCPSAWKRYNSPNRRWSKDINRALAHFRELFPFVPQDEFPRSWPPKACGKLCR